jgi:hypothetical protein
MSSLPSWSTVSATTRLAVVGVRDVGPNGEAPTAERLDPCLGLFELLDTARADRDVSTRLGQGPWRTRRPSRTKTDGSVSKPMGRTTPDWRA